MDNTGSTATIECAFKNILKTYSNGEKIRSKGFVCSSSCIHTKSNPAVKGVMGLLRS